MVEKKKWNVHTAAAIGLTVTAVMAALLFCFSTVHTINLKMNESATSSLLSTTRVIEDTLEGFIDRDYDSLGIVGDICMDEGKIDTGQLLAFCERLKFDWIGITDKYGEGMDSLGNQFRLSDYPESDGWSFQQTGYSDAYIGRLTGRQQITLWVPLYRENQYIGTVFGNVLLTKYYSANVFTFYGGDGRTYLFNGEDGSWILKSLGTDGASTRQQDIYSLLLASGNEEKDVDAFRQAIEARKAGTAVFNFNGEQSYLCFLPLSSSANWYVATVIAKDILLRESSEVQRMIRWVLAILCVTLTAAAVAYAIWQIRKTKEEEAHYREALFANVSANLDSSFLIYEKEKKKTAFVSDNVKRLLGLEESWLKEDAGHLFDWCRIEEEDPQRTAFLQGTLDEAAVRVICMEDELGVSSRYIRLELIPADLGQEIAVMTDITKDKEIQSSLIEAMRQAEAASDAKNDFLSAMSHDIRTPINGVVGMTAIAAANLEDKNRVRDCLSKISESTSHLLNLINEVLDMSQIESGKIELTNEPFNLAELLQQVLNMNYPGVQQKNQTFNVHIHLMEHEEVIGDPVRLTRIVTNLISNAIKYTPSGGTITMALREKKPVMQGYGCYELTVQDNGIGMSEEFQKRLFEPFEREEDVRISRIQGTGLGMSIVKNIVSLMKGNIEVESEKGKGSCFRVTINLQLAGQVTQQVEQLFGLSVLVTDDDIITCETVTEILCDIGMNGEWAQSGADAVQKVADRHQKKEDYLAVLLDWKMPEMNGIETARRIRAEVGSEVPLIILTAYEWGEIEEEARAAGINAFLSKPIYKAKLLQKMTELITGHTDRSELPRLNSDSMVLTGKRVLLAEDNVLNMEIAVEFLKMMGIQTECVENGIMAVECFLKSEPGTYDLILMDIQMPLMNGYDATRAIRNSDRRDGRTVPIVAMTADAFKRDEQEAAAAGMNEHLPKPISFEGLRRVLMRFLTGYADEADTKEER